MPVLTSKDFYGEKEQGNSIVNQVVSPEPEFFHEDKPEKKIVYVYGHPDNADSERYTGNYVVDLPTGEQVTVKVIQGSIRTERKDVAEALHKIGFYFVKEMEKKNE